MQNLSRQHHNVSAVSELKPWCAAFRTQFAFLVALGALLTIAPNLGRAAEARVAVAANFSAVAQRLAQQYQQQSGNRIGLSSASTGSLYAQITQGAPFDVFLSADASTPQRLVQEGFAVRASLFTYATGRLVLWSRQPDKVVEGEALLRSGNFNKLAIANPELAPYGAAARDVLQHLGRWDAVQPNLVIGENVGQATQFVLTGNADVGLLPLSLALAAQRQVGGSSWSVPQAWHRPIVQSAVLLKHGSDNVAAKGFLKYLASDTARKLIRELGYD